jgi:dUTP pyrophosphatase
MTETDILFIKKLRDDAALPIRAYDASAAYDLVAYLKNEGGQTFILTIPPNTTKLIRTGLAMRPTSGNLILVCSRSGLATRGIFVANAPGVVDPDYTGEIKVILFNGGMEPHYVRHGDRIAQALIVPYTTGGIVEVSAFGETARGERGFGSSGT